MKRLIFAVKFIFECLSICGVEESSQKQHNVCLPRAAATAAQHWFSLQETRVAFSPHFQLSTQKGKEEKKNLTTDTIKTETGRKSYFLSIKFFGSTSLSRACWSNKCENHMIWILADQFYLWRNFPALQNRGFQNDWKVFWV